MICQICCNQNDRRSSVLCKKFVFMVQELFMNLCERWRVLTAFKLILERFVLVGESIYDELNLIFDIIRFPQNCNLIKTGFESLKVHIDTHRTLAPCLDLLTQLLVVTETRFSVSRRQRLPNLSGCSCRGQDGLDRDRDGSKQRTVDEFVLTFPHLILQISSDDTIGGDRRRWYDDRSIRISGQIVTIK